MSGPLSGIGDSAFLVAFVIWKRTIYVPEQVEMKEIEEVKEKENG